MKKQDLYKVVFGEDQQEEKYKYEGHSFSRSIAGKKYCTRCGLIALNNEFSRWSVDKGCLNNLHPSYKAQRKKTNIF